LSVMVFSPQSVIIRILFDFNGKISFCIWFVLFGFPLVLALDLGAVVPIELSPDFRSPPPVVRASYARCLCFGFFSALASSRRQLSVFIRCGSRFRFPLSVLCPHSGRRPPLLAILASVPQQRAQVLPFPLSSPVGRRGSRRVRIPAISSAGRFHARFRPASQSSVSRSRRQGLVSHAGSFFCPQAVVRHQIFVLPSLACRRFLVFVRRSRPGFLFSAA
jgi:hypothetical protein